MQRVLQQELFLDCAPQSSANDSTVRHPHPRSPVQRFICNKQVPDLHRMYELLKRVTECLGSRMRCKLGFSGG